MAFAGFFLASLENYFFNSLYSLPFMRAVDKWITLSILIKFQIVIPTQLNVYFHISRYYKSLNVVRWKHATSSKRSIENGGKGVSQRDIVLTQFAFIGYVLTRPEKFALTNSLHSREGINHFWRVTGYLLGIPDR